MLNILFMSPVSMLPLKYSVGLTTTDAIIFKAVLRYMTEAVYGKFLNTIPSLIDSPLPLPSPKKSVNLLK